MDISSNIKQLKEVLGILLFIIFIIKMKLSEYWKEFNEWYKNIPELEELHNIYRF